MPVLKRSYSVLIVSGKTASSDFIAAMLQSLLYAPIETASSAGEAKRKMLGSDYDIIIVDSPLPDEFGQDFASDISASSHSGVLLLVKAEVYDRTCHKVEDYGVLTLPKPVTKQIFYHTVKLITATSARLINAEHKNKSLQEKIEEIRLVNRAKFILIEKRNMTEPEAHRYIEKTAMDMRLAKKEVALDIINN